jgi:hypothetical protein
MSQTGTIGSRACAESLEGEFAAGRASSRPDRHSDRSGLATRFAQSLMLVRLLFPILGLFSTEALGQTLPDFPSDVYCRRIANAAGAFSRPTYEECLDTERRAQALLRSQWPSVPGTVRDRCRRVATMAENGSYSALLGCVGMGAVSSPTEAQTPLRHRFVLVRPPNDNASSYDSLDECLGAREKLLPEIAVCIYRP